MIFIPSPPSGSRHPSLILTFLFLLFTLSLAEIAETDNGNECSCFVTNSSTSAYYVNHRFYDYRDLSDASNSPALLTSESLTANANVTSDFFASDYWNNDWTIQAWNNSASVNDSDPNAAQTLMINSPNNIYISTISSEDPLGTSDPAHKTHLTLRTARTTGFQSAAEFDSVRQNYHHLSARFLARVAGSPGACAGLFTYLGPSDSSPNPKRQVQEADIEILTSGPRDVVQYTNQPSVDVAGNVLPQATSNASLPTTRDWASWNVYRVDWLESGTTWYVNGEKVADISYQVPRDPASLILNMWSDGGDWTGEMAVHDQAYLELQWMQVVFNTSGPYAGSQGSSNSKKRELDSLEKRGGGCKVICSVDKDTNSSSVGTPIVVQSGSSSRLLPTIGFAMWSLLLGVVMVIV